MFPDARLITRIAFACTRFALVTWLATWMVAVVTLAAGGSVAAWQGWIGVACGCLALMQRRLRPWHRVAMLAFAMVFSGLALAASMLAPDLTFDANLYHFPGAFALTDGWNPIWDRWAPVVAESASINVDEIVRCYPKAGYVWFAVARDWFGNIDAGKALTFWLVLAPAGPAFAFFRLMLRQTPLLSGLATLLVCANPVVLTQILTGYNDVHVSALLSTLLFSALLATGKGFRGAATLAAMAAALLIGVKFTGLVYVCAITAVMVAYGWLRRGWPRAYFWRALLGGVLGVLLAFDSYGLNAIAKGNPFFPAWQPGKVTVIDSQAALAFRQRNRVDKLVRSLGAPQADAHVEYLIDPEIRLPFTKVRWQPRHEARFSGFGPLFWEALLVSLVAVVGRRRAASCAALAAVLVSTLATDAGWWPRLAPQVWLLPILLVMRPREPAGARSSLLWGSIASAVFLLLALNLAMIARGAASEAYRASDWWYLRVLRLDTTPDSSLTHEDVRRSFQRRFRDLAAANGIAPDVPIAHANAKPSWRERLALGLGCWGANAQAR